MEDTPLSRRGLGAGTGGSRMSRSRMSPETLAATAVPGRERVFLLDKFIQSGSKDSPERNAGPHAEQAVEQMPKKMAETQELPIGTMTMPASDNAASSANSGSLAVKPLLTDAEQAVAAKAEDGTVTDKDPDSDDSATLDGDWEVCSVAKSPERTNRAVRHKDNVPSVPTSAFAPQTNFGQSHTGHEDPFSAGHRLENTVYSAHPRLANTVYQPPASAAGNRRPKTQPNKPIVVVGSRLVRAGESDPPGTQSDRPGDGAASSQDSDAGTHTGAHPTRGHRAIRPGEYYTYDSQGQPMHLPADQRDLAGLPALLSCPPDVFNNICSTMPCATQELLGRTCKTMRRRLHPLTRNAIRNMTGPQFAQYQTALAQGLPWHMVCALCHRLHRAIPEDVPTRGYPSVYVRQFCTHYEYLAPFCLGIADLGFGYCLQYQHIQLALKFSRMGLVPAYVEALLQPYRVMSDTLATRVAVQALFRPVLTLHEARPSFLLYRKIEFSQHQCEEAQPLEAATIQHIALCPHASLSEGDHEDMRSPVLYAAIEDANLGLHTHRDVSCVRCATDVALDTLPGRLCVRVWHDFGPEGVAPTDDAWLVNVGGPTNNEYVGPAVAHARGTVRSRYEYTLRQQGPGDVLSVLEGSFPVTALSFRRAAVTNVLHRLNGRDLFAGFSGRSNH